MFKILKYGLLGGLLIASVPKQAAADNLFDNGFVSIQLGFPLEGNRHHRPQRRHAERHHAAPVYLYQPQHYNARRNHRGYYGHQKRHHHKRHRRPDYVVIERETRYVQPSRHQERRGYVQNRQHRHSHPQSYRHYR